MQNSILASALTERLKAFCPGLRPHLRSGLGGTVIIEMNGPMPEGSDTADLVRKALVQVHEKTRRTRLNLEAEPFLIDGNAVEITGDRKVLKVRNRMRHEMLH